MNRQRAMFKLLAVVTMATMFFQFAPMLPVASAQEENPSYVWHTFFGSSSYADGVTGIAADNSGNVYVSGSSNGSWNGPGGVPPLRPYPYSPGYSASVLVKYNSDGVYQWHSFMPGGNVKVDTNGNVYLIGSTDATFNGPNGEAPINPFNDTAPLCCGTDIFLMKLNSAGVYQWHTFAGGYNEDNAIRMTVDNTGNVYVVGWSWEGAEWANPLNPHTTPCCNPDIVVVKFSSDGIYQWHTYYGRPRGGSGDSADDIAQSVAVDATGNVVVVGVSRGSWNGPGGIAPLNPHSSELTYDMVILSLTSNGQYRWHSFYGASGISNNTDSATGVAIDGTGDIVVAGLSRDSWSGPGGIAPLNPHATVNNDDIVVLKLSNNGAYEWHTFYGSPSGDGSNDVVVDANNNILLTGNSNSAASWNGPGGQLPLNPKSGSTYNDIVVMKIASGGVYQWHTFYGSLYPDASSDIAIGQPGQLYIGGSSDRSWNGPGGIVPLNPHAGTAASDGVVIKMLSPVTPPTPSAKEPVILLPGGTGSRIFSKGDFNWLQPSGHDGTYYPDTGTPAPYHKDEEIWINLGQIGLSGPDDYFDVMRLEKNGVTQSTDQYYGVKLEAQALVPIVYDSLLVDLENADYQPGVDLFSFPYDWRLDTASNAALLDSLVQVALTAANGTSDSSQWTITKVNLISHSLGGSLAREYIRDPLHAARVHRLIAIAPAFLGAPKFTRLLLFGDPFQCILYVWCPLNPAEVKDIAQNMPGLFEVAPSRAYWTFYDGSSGNPVAFQEDRDFDGDGQVSGALSYTSYKSMLFRLNNDANLDWDGNGKDINQTVFNMSESFHDLLDLSWDSGIPVPEVDLIAGTGQCTIGQIQPTYRIKLKLPFEGNIEIGPIVHLNFVNGDNTVPLFSATLYDPDRGIDHRGGANVYYVESKSTNHALLPLKDPVRQLVVNLLTGNSSLPTGIIPQADVPQKKCNIVNVESPVELHVTDAAGNHTGWANFPDTGAPAIEQSIPGSMYNETDETKSVVLPDDGVYTISLNSTGSGSFNLNLQSYKSDGTVKSILYLRVPLTTTTTGTMTSDTTSSTPPLLYLDHNGDGIFDATIAATSVLSPAESADTQPPQIEITSPTQGQVSTGNTLISWQVSDSLSGVLNQWGYIDMDTPNALEVTNGSLITLPVGQHTLTVLAEDRAGNASEKVINFNVTTSACMPSNAYNSSQGAFHFASMKSASSLTNFNQLPLSFIPNRGQEDQAVQFQAQGLGGRLFFAPNEVVFALPNPEKVKEDDKEKIRYNRHPANVVRIHYQSANDNPEVIALEELPGVVNILRGNDPSKWQTNLPTYSGIAYREFYPGIELRYEGSDGNLKSTFHVAAGVNPASIVWRYKGATDVTIDASGNLVVSLPEPAGTGAVLIEQAPIAWQEVNGNRVMVPVQYALDAKDKKDKKVSFLFPNGYDTTLPLVIDPTLTYSTYLGGGKTDQADAVTLDADCNIYLTGQTLSLDFPTVNPVQGNQPNSDVFVTKLNSTGSSILYSTYIGGNAADHAWGINRDSQGRITLVGETESSNFPLMNAYDTSYAGGTCENGDPCDDVFVTQLLADGSALRYSTYLGGSSDDEAYGVALGPDDKINLTGWTRSSMFPRPNGYDTSFGGGTCSGFPCEDVFVSKIDPALSGTASLLYGTFLGGNNYDKAKSIAVDASGHIYITGYTRSDTYPTLNAYQPARASSSDSFITKLNPAVSGSASLLYSTYFGGNESDHAYGIAVNGANQVYLTGFTQSTNLPPANPFDNTFGGGTCGSSACHDAFVIYLNIANNQLVFSSYLGGSHEDEGAGITVDDSGNAYITGYTKSTNFNTLAAIQPAKATDSCSTPPCADAFVTKVSSAGALVYSTYLGGSAEDYGNAIVVDGLGSAYIAGYTFSSNFPGAINPFTGTSGYADAFVVKIQD